MISAEARLDAIPNRPDAVTDFQADVPEKADQRLDFFLVPGIRLPLDEEEDVDIRKREKLASPVASDRHKAGAAGHAGVFPQGCECPVDQPSVVAKQSRRRGDRGELGAQFPAPGLQERADPVDG